MTKQGRSTEGPLLSFLQRSWEALLQAVFPPKCLVCNSFSGMQAYGHGVSSDTLTRFTLPYFCASCREGFTPIASPLCPNCGLPFVSKEGEDHTCSDCLTEEKHFRKARAFGIYEGSFMEAIHRFKYAKKTSLARPLGGLAKETFLRFWREDSVDLVVPVPLHLKRLRERGFNQAYLMSRKWAQEEEISLDGLTLCRTRWTKPQTTLSRKERQKNVKGAFAVRYPERIRGKKVLLVDDVYTTGSTVNECAKVLMEEGAERVDVLTLARAL